MECTVNQRKKQVYQLKLWLLAAADAGLFAAGCIAMIRLPLAESVRSLMAILMIGVVGSFFPVYLLLIRGLTIAGTHRVFLQDDTVWIVRYDADNGEGGVRYHFYKLWKVSEYRVSGDAIEIKAFVWYDSKKIQHQELPVSDGCLGEINGFTERAERCQRTISLRRIYDREDELIRILEKRRQALPSA